MRKINHNNVKLCNKNVNVVEKNYAQRHKISAKVSYSEGEALFLLANRVSYTMTTPISSHVKDKDDMFTASGKDMICRKRENPSISSVSI